MKNQFDQKNMQANINLYVHVASSKNNVKNFESVGNNKLRAREPKIRIPIDIREHPQRYDGI